MRAPSFLWIYSVLWLVSSALLLMGLTRPVIGIAVNVESVLKDAVDQQPVIGLLLQSRGIRLSDMAGKLPPSSSTKQSIVSSALKLFRLKCYSASLLILLFSIVVPVIKQGVFLAILGLPRQQSHRLVALTQALHKWSMVDVFVLAMIVLMLSSASAWNAELLDGFYWFLGYFFLAAALGTLVAKPEIPAPPRVAPSPLNTF